MKSVNLTPAEDYPTATLSQKIARPTGLALGPLLVAQGRAMRRKRPRLPNAPLPWSGRIDGPDPLSLISLGDSTIAGVGVDDAMQGLSAHLARGLYRRTARGITWDSFGQRGATTTDVVEKYLPAAIEKTSKADVVMISVGANDAITLRPVRGVLQAMEQLVTTLHSHHPHAILMVSSLPAFHLFDTIPQPLRAVMSGHAQAIERQLRPLVEALDYALMSPPPPNYPQEFFAADSFHPSSTGYSIWAEFALSDAESRGALDHLRSR